MRPSERSQSDHAIVFKTETEVRNWKVTMAEGKFTVKPYPQTFSSLEDVVMVSEASEVRSCVSGLDVRTTLVGCHLIEQTCLCKLPTPLTCTCTCCPVSVPYCLSTYVYVLYPSPSCLCRQWEKPTTLP